MNIIKSVRDGKYVCEYNGFYFRENTRLEALTKLLAFLKEEIFTASSTGELAH